MKLFPLSRFYSNLVQPIFNLCASPFRYLGNLFSSSVVDHNFDYSSLSSIFDLYIASGNDDEDWLNRFVFPILREKNITYTRRDMSDDDDQIEIHIRKRSRLLYYLINDTERLSHLATELAFLIGERQHHLIVYLQTSIRENSSGIRSKHERLDVERSRRYLEDLATKEKISLYHSREESWQHVLNFC